MKKKIKKTQKLTNHIIKKKNSIVVSSNVERSGMVSNELDKLTDGHLHQLTCAEVFDRRSALLAMRRVLSCGALVVHNTGDAPLAATLLRVENVAYVNANERPVHASVIDVRSSPHVNEACLPQVQSARYAGVQYQHALENVDFSTLFEKLKIKI